MILQKHLIATLLILQCTFNQIVRNSFIDYNMTNRMRKFSIKDKLYIPILLGVSIVMAPQIVISPSYAQDNSIVSNGSAASK